MYLPLWGVDRKTNELLWKTSDVKYEVRGQDRLERAIKHENKNDALRQTLVLTGHDKRLMTELHVRQSEMARGCLVLTLDALATAPFTTGLGNEHPLENGFAFLNPYGLPYLPGSGVKGVLRQAARELQSGQWGDAKGCTEDAITHLFGLASDDGGKMHQRGALMFWDVLPQLKGESLQVEVMTPHQSHYYQQRRDAKSGDSTSPHDSGQPNPIHFLTVPPGSRFTFHVQCDVPFLRGHSPALAEGDRWKVLLQAAFEHAFEWLGFGAKTAVGYGAMQEDEQARQQRDAARAAAEAEVAAAAAQARLDTLSPEDRAWELAQGDLERFRADLAKAQAAGAYTPGGPFNQTRQAFVKAALAWTETRSRAAAAALIEQSATKAWGRPSNKERWTELQTAIAQLKTGT
jgi:CRISPR-associated protein Cmr6